MIIFRNWCYQCKFQTDLLSENRSNYANKIKYIKILLKQTRDDWSSDSIKVQNSTKLYALDFNYFDHYNINKVLRNLIDLICVIYLNNILIFDNVSTQHWRHVKMMFERFRDYKLYVNLKKCEFDITQIEFLNFIIFIDEVSMNSKKMRTIEKWSRSTTYREFQMFLNFVNFYKRFVYRFFHIIIFLLIY